MENLLEVSVAAALGFLASTALEYFKPFMAERQKLEALRRLLYLDMIRITAYAEVQLKNPTGLPSVFPDEPRPKGFSEATAMLINNKLLQYWYIHDYSSLKRNNVVDGSTFKRLSAAPQYFAAFAALGNEGKAISDFYAIVDRSGNSSDLSELLAAFEKFSIGPLRKEYIQRAQKELLLPALDDLFFCQAPSLFRPILRWGYIHFFGEDFPVTRYFARGTKAVGVFMLRLALAIIFVAVVSFLVLMFAPGLANHLRDILK